MKVVWSALEEIVLLKDQKWLRRRLLNRQKGVVEDATNQACRETNENPSGTIRVKPFIVLGIGGKFGFLDSLSTLKSKIGRADCVTHEGKNTGNLGTTETKEGVL